MEQRTIDSVPGAGNPAAEMPAPYRSREQVRQEVQKALDRAVGSHGRAAVIVIEINPNYARRAQERVASVAGSWGRRRSERLDIVPLAANRFVLVAAPVGLPQRARALADDFARALDPRICPLLSRALPYACAGASLYPDDGLESETLLARAEQALERTRSAAARCRKPALTRRRHATAAVLRPVAAR